MAYKHKLNFWPLVPAVDIQAIYEIIKSNNSDSVDSNMEIIKSSSSESNNDNEVQIIESSSSKNIDCEVEILETDATKNIPVPDIPYNEDENKHFISNVSFSGKKEMNILIIGDGTGCLIKSIARLYRHEAETLNIYIISKYAECLARNLLFLSLLHEPISNMGILDKTEIFLEIFGNTFLRASTLDFIETKSASILKDFALSTHLLPSVPTASLEFLKRREIDEISKIMFFLKDSDSTYDIGNAWKNSLRAYFGTRYDNRKNMFVYQYNMHLTHYPVMNLRKYLEWCETGTAFKLHEAAYGCPNKTLCIQSIVSSVEASDFFCGDITTSPYITFGVECGNKTVFDKVNNVYSYTSEDISKFNVKDFMMEFSSMVPQGGKKLNIFPVFYPTFLEKLEFRNFFDAAYITRDIGAYITRDKASYIENHLPARVLKKDGLAIFETMKNFVNSTKELKVKYSNQIDRLARMNDLKAVGTLAYGCFKIFTSHGLSGETVEI